jgi:hypothetical protein
MTVTAMGAGDPIQMGQVSANPDGRGLFAHVKMDEAGHFPFFVKNPGGLLEVAEKKHLFIEPQALLFSRDGSRGSRGRAARTLLGTGFWGGRFHLIILERGESGRLSFFLI